MTFIYAQTVHLHFLILIKILHNLSQNSYETLYILGAEKMAKLTKCQLLKQEDLSFDPQYSHKTPAWQKLSVISALGGQKQVDPCLDRLAKRKAPGSMRSLIFKKK